jgi:transposase
MLGHTVIVADPGFAAMYATRPKRVKTDKRDARTRTRSVAIIKAFVRREGLRLPSGETEQTVSKLAALPLPPHVLEAAPAVVTAYAATCRRPSERSTI